MQSTNTEQNSRPSRRVDRFARATRAMHATRATCAKRATQRQQLAACRRAARARGCLLLLEAGADADPIFDEERAVGLRRLRECARVHACCMPPMPFWFVFAGTSDCCTDVSSSSCLNDAAVVLCAWLANAGLRLLSNFGNPCLQVQCLLQTQRYTTFARAVELERGRNMYLCR